MKTLDELRVFAARVKSGDATAEEVDAALAYAIGEVDYLRGIAQAYKETAESRREIARDPHTGRTIPRPCPWCDKPIVLYREQFKGGHSHHIRAFHIETASDDCGVRISAGRSDTVSAEYGAHGAATMTATVTANARAEIEDVLAVLSDDIDNPNTDEEVRPYIVATRDYFRRCLHVGAAAKREARHG